MPDGTVFETEGILGANGDTGGSSTSQPYRGIDLLSIRNAASGWDICLELPRVEFENNYPPDESISREQYLTYFAAEYPYELVREKMLQEMDWVKADASYSSIIEGKDKNGQGVDVRRSNLSSTWSSISRILKYRELPNRSS